MERKGQTSGGIHWLISDGSEHHLVTRKTTLLFSVPLGVVTSTLPVVAPAGNGCVSGLVVQ
jgi:hypothetical protein